MQLKDFKRTDNRNLIRLFLSLTIIVIFYSYANAAQATSEISIISIYRTRNNNPVLDCSFNGIKVDKGCLLDLGNGDYDPFLPDSLVEQFSSLPDLISQPKRPIALDNCRAKKLDQLKIGSINFRASAIFQCSAAMDGLGNIGVKAFEGKIWKFDFIENSIEEVHQLPMNVQHHSMIRNGGHIVIQALIGTQLFLTELDTGASISFFDKRFVEANRNLFRLENGYSEETSTTVFRSQKPLTTSQGLLANEIKFYASNMDESEQYKNVLKSGASAVLGFDVIQNHVWYFDLKNEQWAVEVNSSL